MAKTSRKYKLFSKKEISDSKILDKLIEDQLIEFNHSKIFEDTEFNALSKLVKLNLTSDKSYLSHDNKVEVLQNGENKFPEVLKSLQAAKSHIHIEYYIISNDIIGNKIFDILKSKSKEGIEVRLIYDSVGSSDMNSKKVNELAKSGIEVEAFMPVLIPYTSDKANYRNHRKIMVIDGVSAFVGGINIEDKYINSTGQSDLYWRDTHLKIEGNAVKSLQVLFIFNWYFTSKKALSYNDKYFPEITPKGNTYVQIIGSGPDSDYANIMQAFFTAITSAKKSIRITSPYFIPNTSLITAIRTAAMGGISVEIIIPRKPDSKIVGAAMMSYMQDLLKSGVRVYMYTQGFIHSKTLIIDNLLSTIGTANMDYRSFETNFEVNALVYDTKIAQDLLNQFEEDKMHCTELLITRWEKRKITKKLSESVARLLAPLL